MNLFTVALTATLALPLIADAAPEPLAIRAKPAERQNTINIDPFDALLGTARLNYERLWNGTHGLLVEGWVGQPWDGGPGAYRVGGAVGYRWHWRGRQNSGFLGLTLTHAAAKGTAEIEENGTRMKYRFEGRVSQLTANIGKRWMLTDAVNITLRFGLGYADYKVESEAADPAALRQAGRVSATQINPWEDLNIGLEGELTAGYAF